MCIYMNICIIGQYPPQVGGIATYTNSLREELIKDGHNVYVLTYPQNCSRNDNVFEANVVNIPVIRGLSFILSSYRKLIHIIDEYDIDIVHSNYILPPGLVAALTKRKKDVKIIVSVHGSDINILPNNKILKPIIKYTLNHADNIYFVSKQLQKKADKLNIKDLNKKSYITPNTVNTNKFNPTNTEHKLRQKYKKPIVMFIGNLVKQKGLTYLLDAKINAKSDYVLLIYGDGKEKTTLTKQITQHNIKDVYLMGKTTTPEKIIPEADIMVLPSVSEGASIVALESMSCAKAFISTDVGNIKDIIKNYENGVIVPAKDSQELTHAIDKLVNDKELRIKIGENARRTIIEEYSKMNIPYLNE